MEEPNKSRVGYARVGEVGGGNGVLASSQTIQVRYVTNFFGQRGVFDIHQHCQVGAGGSETCITEKRAFPHLERPKTKRLRGVTPTTVRWEKNWQYHNDNKHDDKLIKIQNKTRHTTVSRWDLSGNAGETDGWWDEKMRKLLESQRRRGVWCFNIEKWSDYKVC